VTLAAIRTIYRRLAPRGVQTRVAAARQHARHFGARRDPRFNRSLERLAALRNSYVGETCVVIGNGPSMRGFDLSRLSGLHSFCLNRGYLMWKEQGRTPDFLVAVNRLVIEQFAAELQEVNALKFAPWLLRSHFDQGDENLVFFEERWDEAFIDDARDGLSSLATVTNTALQLAWHMGFSTVILIGVDHHFAASAKGRPHEMVVQAVDDVDHFRPDYFAPGTRWHLPDLDLSERGYRLAKQAFEGAGRRIVNATEGTKLDIFERIDLSDILDAVPDRLRRHEAG
jgi:hypothetical protein